MEKRMGKLVEGMVAGKRRWAERLYSLQIAAEVAPFHAGQFTKLALDINEEVVGRAYSFINAPGETPLEFYFIEVPGGLLTQRLAALEVGDAVWVAPQAAGFLTLAEVPDAKHLWLLSTHTGIAPFLSILKTDAPWQRFEHIVLAHAVRHAEELAYGETIRDFAQQHGEQFRFVPFVSREETAKPSATSRNNMENSFVSCLSSAARKLISRCGRASRKLLPMAGLKPGPALHLRRKIRK